MKELNSAFSIPSTISFFHRNTHRFVGTLLLAAASIQSTPEIENKNWRNLIGQFVLLIGVLLTIFFKRGAQSQDELNQDISGNTLSYTWKVITNSLKPIKDQRRTLSLFMATSSIVTFATAQELNPTKGYLAFSTTVASLALSFPTKHETGWIFWGFATTAFQSLRLPFILSDAYNVYTLPPTAIYASCGFLASSCNLLFHQYVAADYTQGFKNKIHALLYGKDESITLL